jgi:drug/metabolite transporter (DMT)-like permease
VSVVPTQRVTGRGLLAVNLAVVLFGLAGVLGHLTGLPAPLVILGVGCTAVAHTLFLAGLQLMTAQLASLLAGLEPVWAILLGILILGEWPAGRSVAGGAIIVAATIVPTALAYRART